MTHATAEPRRDLVGDIWLVLRALKRCTTGGEHEGPALGVLSQLQSLGPVRLSDLAPALGLDASTVSRHVKALEDGACIVRAADPSDRRATHLQLTERGRAVLAEGLRRRRAVLDSALAEWSDTDRDILEALVRRLADDLERTHATETTR